MVKTSSKTHVAANILDALSFLASVAFLAAITQHVNHLNQLSQHFVATYLSHSESGSFTVKPDFQLVPLVPVAILLIAAALLVRKRLSMLLAIALAVFISGGVVWIYGFHLVHV